MNMNEDDKKLLEELCREDGVDSEKVLKLLETVREYESKDRRNGVYDALKDILEGRA